MLNAAGSAGRWVFLCCWENDEKAFFCGYSFSNSLSVRWMDGWMKWEEGRMLSTKTTTKMWEGENVVGWDGMEDGGW
jgi:hypothetical protein